VLGSSLGLYVHGPSLPSVFAPASFVFPRRNCHFVTDSINSLIGETNRRRLCSRTQRVSVMREETEERTYEGCYWFSSSTCFIQSFSTRFFETKQSLLPTMHQPRTKRGPPRIPDSHIPVTVHHLTFQHSLPCSFPHFSGKGILTHH
jgi:hypothetical protein